MTNSFDDLNTQSHPNTPTISPSAETGSETRFWSLNGRIGRLRYIAYSVAAVSLAIIMAYVYHFMWSSDFEPGWIQYSKNPFVTVLAGIAARLAQMMMSRRRLQDLNASGWITLIHLTPYLGHVLTLVLIIMKGNEGNNRFGPEPAANTAWVGAGVVVGVLSLIIYVITHVLPF